jgi:Dolichyl-phosphate-mannose-protein mannosyltransferase
MTTYAVAKKNFIGKWLYRRIFLGVVGILELAWFVLWLLRSIQYIRFPQIEYSEGFLVYNARLFAQGTWSWVLGTQPPFNVSFYTPLIYYLVGWLGGSLLAGRALVLTFFVAGLVLVYLIVKLITKNSIFAVMAAIFPLTSYLIGTWSLFFRVDMPAVTFELAGLYVALRWYKCGWLYLSILFFVLAFWTKQSVATAAIAVCIYNFTRNWRFGIGYMVLLGGAVVGSLLIATAFYGKEWLYHVFLYTRTAELIRPWNDIFAYGVVAYIPIIPLIAMACVYVSRNLKSLVSIFAMTALVLNLLLITRPGGAQNYFFEPILAISIAAGCSIPIVLQKQGKKYIAFFAFSLWALVSINDLVGYPDAGYPARMQQAEALIQDATYPILTENAGIVVDAGKQPYCEPFVFNQLARLGYWDEDILLNDLKTHRVQYVVSQFMLPYKDVQRFTPEIQAAIVENYDVILDYSSYRVGSFVVWKAKGGDPSKTK